MNALSSVLDFGSTMVASLLVTPVLLRTLDSSLFGVWKILQQLVDYMAAADGRPTQALKWVIANQQQADGLTKRRTVTSAFATYLIYLPVLLVFGGVLIWLSPALAKTPSELDTIVRLTCALLVFNFILSGLAQLPAAALRGENQGYRRMGLAAGLTLVGGGLTILAARLGLGLVGVASAQVVVAAGTGIFFSLVVKRYLPWYGFTRPTWSDVRHFLGYSNWFFVSIIVNRLLFATDVVVLGYRTAPTLVTVYAVTQFASTTAVGLIAAMVGSMVPGLGGVLGHRERERGVGLRVEMTSYSWLLATIIGTGTLLLNRSFIHLWVGLEGRYAGPVPNMLIVLLAFQQVFIRNESYIIDLSLNIVRKVWLGLAAAAVSTTLAWLLIPTLGIVGLCIGLLVGRTVLTIAYPMLVQKYLGEASRLSLRRLARRGLITGALFGVAAYAGEHVLLGNWAAWVLAACLVTGATAGGCIGVGLSVAERRQVLGRMQAVYAGRRR